MNKVSFIYITKNIHDLFMWQLLDSETETINRHNQHVWRLVAPLKIEVKMQIRDDNQNEFSYD